jgi:hypothetical protein
MTRIPRFVVVTAVVAAGALALPAARPAAAPAAEPPDRSEIQFRVGEPVLLGWLQAVTPYTVSVGTPPLGTELTFSEPRDLVLRDGQATFKIRVRGRPIPVDQVLAPAIAVRYEPRLQRYQLVVSSLTVQVPGIGAIDLKSYFPPLEFPALLDNLWRSEERPYGLSLTLRRVRILDHAVEIGADARFTREGGPTAALGGRHGG